MTVKIEVENIIEHEDGSATVVLNYNADAHHMLVQEGFKSLLEKAVSEDYKHEGGEK